MIEGSVQIDQMFSALKPPMRCAGTCIGDFAPSEH